MAPKTVMFTMDLGDAPRAPGAPNENEEGHTKLEDMVQHKTTPFNLFELSISLNFRPFSDSRIERWPDIGEARTRVYECSR